MQVAHLTSAHPRDDVRIFLKECRSLSRSGYAVTLIVADGLGNDTRDGVDILDVGRPAGRLDRMLSTTRRVLRQAIDLDADVYHVHDPELLTICLALKRRGKRVVFDAHEDVPKQILGKHYLQPMLRRAIAWVFACYERYVCGRLDGVIAATPTIRQKFLSINANSQDINNYPLIGELNVETEAGQRANEVCYVGGIAAIRGVREMIRALELAQPDIHLNLVGAFVESDVEKEVQGYPGWQRVNAFGVLGREGVRNVMARSFAGLVTLHPTPNYIESLPIKMFEYMSAGIPVIASDFPLWRDIIEGSECGVCVDPLDPRQIARVIDELARDPSRSQKMGENGRKTVMERYNWAIEEGKLRAYYAQLATMKK
ncbi:glycosyltransferase family 4 protein [Pusillimonas sp. NJUB218]|uniref:glycosyltransferase family 4 protein n=1 Tax=Pusillimonas sp. NJUB218 TaxID=2023230 RepID=UPI000F4B2697|nr:glycosyltransferase family 4 protein [Pusillimonas sp. NJUB218]ROT44012.1 glycosyl transferase [Pusillimonas sp. NJUB218]